MDHPEDRNLLLHNPHENVQEDVSLSGRKGPSSRLGRRRVAAHGAIVFLLALAFFPGCGQKTATTTLVYVSGSTTAVAPITTTTPPTAEKLSTTSTTHSPEEIAQQWYQQGAYMGYWAGNVETIPAKSAHLPDYFFSGPTPSAPILRDGEGKPLQEDPSAIKKPLWVFGDEVRVGDYADQIRQAKIDGRPILFYATSVANAVSALGLEQQTGTNTPLERLIVDWLPWDNARDGTVNVVSWNLDVAPPGAMIFRELVSASLAPPRQQ